MVVVGVTEEYQLSREGIEAVFGQLRGKYGLEGQQDVADRIKRYNTRKAATNLYC